MAVKIPKSLSEITLLEPKIDGSIVLIESKIVYVQKNIIYFVSDFKSIYKKNISENIEDLKNS